jgi:plasmid stabilization system protein ParE
MDDIANTFDYLFERSPEAAGRWYRQVRNHIRSLAEMPERCTVTPESFTLGIKMRQLLCGRPPGVYRIVFRIAEDTREVHVLTVRHTARRPLSDDELEALLEEDH